VGAGGVRPGSIAAGAIMDADINNSAAIAINKLAVSGALGANVIVSSIAINSVYANAILDNAVTSAKIADGTIIAADIAMSTISLDKLNQSGCVTGQIPSGTARPGPARRTTTLLTLTPPMKSACIRTGATFQRESSSSPCAATVSTAKPTGAAGRQRTLPGWTARRY